MKVKELLEKLRAFDPDQDVICYCEDEGVKAFGHDVSLFDISSVDLQDAEKTRTGNGVPSLKLGKTENSVANVLIEITSDF
ncbi:MAG: hypothetical protein ACYSWP_24475 [Planctomycetota bacterium]|jgi:hypothetical protein